MSNFSYPSEFPVGLTILDLTNSSTTIADLNLNAARTNVEWQLENGVANLYTEWDDNIIGSMWPIGMTLADAMHYYWNAPSLSFSGISGEFYLDFGNPDETIFVSSGTSNVNLFSRYRNFRTNYGCPPNGYDAFDFGDQIYSSKIVRGNNCLLAQASSHVVESFNYDTCQITPTNIDFNVLGFSPSLAFLNIPFFGGDGTQESLRQNYPSIIKMGNLYYPAILISFFFESGDPEAYGVFDATTFKVLYRARRTSICDPPPPDPNYSYQSLFYEDVDGPYDIEISGFPSGNTYNIPVYNIFSCTVDDFDSCETFDSFCQGIPFNIEMGSLEIIP